MKRNWLVGWMLVALFSMVTRNVIAIENGVVTTLAGSVTNSGSANGTNRSARFYWPMSIAMDSHSNLFVADYYNDTIRKLTPVGTNWVVTTIAGSVGSQGTNDGTGSAARFNYPSSVAVDSSDNVYVADYGNDTIRKLAPVGANWVVTTLAGSAKNAGQADGTGSAARFFEPMGVAVDHAGNVYVADTFNDAIRKVTPAGVVTTLAGKRETTGFADGTGTNALFNNPVSVAVDSTGNVYVADSYNQAIRKVAPVGANWVVTTLAGDGQYSAGHTDGTGTNAQFYGPIGLATDANGNVYVADSQNDTIRKVTPAGVVSTIAGSAEWAGSVDAVGSAARFDHPAGVAIDGAGNLYVADQYNQTIRKVTRSPCVLLQAGNGGMAGLWMLDANDVPAAWAPVTGAMGSGWILSAISQNRILLQQGLGGQIGIWTLDANGAPVKYWPVNGPLPGWIARDLDGNHILLQAGDGGPVGIWTLNANNTPATWANLSGPVANLIARGLSGNRVLLQFGNGNPAGYWTLNNSNVITAWTPLTATVPAGWVLRAMTPNNILLQAGDGGMAGLWDLDANGQPTAWHTITGAMPGWILRDIDQQ